MCGLNFFPGCTVLCLTSIFLTHFKLSSVHNLGLICIILYIVSTCWKSCPVARWVDLMPSVALVVASVCSLLLQQMPQGKLISYRPEAQAITLALASLWSGHCWLHHLMVAARVWRMGHISKLDARGRLSLWVSSKLPLPTWPKGFSMCAIS